MPLASTQDTREADCVGWQTVVAQLQADGFADLDLGSSCRPAVWDAFRRSWDTLAIDRYMADGGSYRRRAFGMFAATCEKVVRLPHSPHFQAQQFNRLNGGVQRWFEPIAEEPYLLACLSDLTRECVAIIDQASGTSHGRWHVEAHQFRIEANGSIAGLPTPEGIHRDGREWVLIMLVDVRNVRGGRSTIHSLDGDTIREQRLAVPGRAILLDDRRVLHGTTAIQQVDAGAAAYRDVLVLTFAQRAASA